MSETGTDGSVANNRYGRAGDLLLEANRNVSPACCRHRVLLRDLLHRKHNWLICNLIDKSPSRQSLRRDKC